MINELFYNEKGENMGYVVGDVCEISFGWICWSSDKGWYDSKPEDIGKKVVIKLVDKNKYEVMFFEDGNTVAWYEDYQLKFLYHDDNAIDECKKINDEILKRERDIDYIRKKVLENEFNLSSASILKLFEKVNFNSVFLRNGEYYALYNDWYYLCRLFKMLFMKKRESMNENIKEMFKEQYVEKYIDSFNNFYDEVNK